VELEPLSSLLHSLHAAILNSDYQFVKALEFANKGIELDVNSYVNHYIKGLALIGMKDFENSIKSFQTALKISNRHPWSVAGLAWAHHELGDDSAVLELFNELESRKNENYIPFNSLVTTAVLVGNVELGLDYCQQGVDKKDPFIYTIRFPIFSDEIIKDERFRKIHQQLGLPE